jgi:hypothetical protein
VQVVTDNNSLSIGSISGTDTYGYHANGSGSCTTPATQTESPYYSSYNGVIFNLQNYGTLPTYQTPTGSYPVLISGFGSDGGSYYAGVFQSQPVTGIFVLGPNTQNISNSFVPLIVANSGVTYYLNDGIDSPTGNTYGYGLTSMPFYLSVPTSNPLIFTSAAGATSNLDLHPGDPRVDMAGSWKYAALTVPVDGIDNLNMTITSIDGNVFTAAVSATIISGGNADTVSGSIQGIYDLLPHNDPSFPGDNNKTYAACFTVPTGGTPLLITNNSGNTTQFDVYLMWIDIKAGLMKVVVNSTGGSEISVVLTKQ